MLINKKLMTIILIALLGLVLTQVPVNAEEANNNIVIVAGETWGTYTPANYDYPWPRYPYNDDISQRGGFGSRRSGGNWIFMTSRCVTSGYFGNPGWSWMSGTYVIDFSNFMYAIEYNPSDEFAALNAGVFGEDNKHYAYLAYNHKIPGWDDPGRNYHDPPNGGANLSPDRTHAWSTAAWPTQLGVDVKLTVHSWTLPYGHLDDFHLVEIQLHNTGEADVNADGIVDISGNRINSLVLDYAGVVFGFRMNARGGRSYWQPNSRYRGFGFDMTPDENGYPWDIPFQGYGTDAGEEDYPGLGYRGFYYDAYHGYTFLGAKKYDESSGTWVEKKLAFKDANGNEVVPAIGEGPQRGWFHTTQPGYNNVNDGTPKGAHTAAMGCFYTDGGKSNDRSMFDLTPNPNLFESGEEGNPTTFIVKDPSEWAYPDGAYEYTTPVMAVDPMSGEELGINPLDPARGRPLEPGIITEGLITEYRFDGEPQSAIGPFALEPGETIRIYFVRGSGFRMNGLRKTIKAARAVFESIQPDCSFNVPQSPPVPEIKVSGSKNVLPLIKWQDPGDMGDYDGIKIYKSVAWPRFNPLYKGFPQHDTWWKTMDPANQPDPVPYNPLFKKMELIRDQQGEHWGPYELVKVIPRGQFENYKNPDSDKNKYPYAWEDDTYSSPGQSYWYYVASYKEGAAASLPPQFAGLEPPDITWLESGKVNFNGRSALWTGSWPQSERHAYFPKETDIEGRKAIGARFVLVSPTASIPDIELDRAEIGVRPNPYKRAAFHDVGVHQVMFYNLPQTCDIKIYDLAGMLVDEIQFQAATPENGVYFWDMYSKNGNEVASGLYIWVVQYEGGQQTGTFAIIR